MRKNRTETLHERLCEIALAKMAKDILPVMRNTTSDNSSRSTLIANSENMTRTFIDFRMLLLLIH
jgi:hypothetical protein